MQKKHCSREKLCWVLLLFWIEAWKQEKVRVNMNMRAYSMFNMCHTLVTSSKDFFFIFLYIYSFKCYEGVSCPLKTSSWCSLICQKIVCVLFFFIKFMSSLEAESVKLFVINLLGVFFWGILLLFPTFLFFIQLFFGLSLRHVTFQFDSFVNVSSRY